MLRAHRVMIATSRRLMLFTYEGGPIFDTRRGAADPTVESGDGERSFTYLR